MTDLKAVIQRAKAPSFPAYMAGEQYRVIAAPDLSALIRAAESAERLAEALEIVKRIGARTDCYDLATEALAEYRGKG